MAYYFAWDSDELEELCPGWARPLDEPRQVEFRNPFTGETQLVASWTPEGHDFGGASDGVDLDQPDALALENVDFVPLTDLCEAALGTRIEPVPAMIGPPDSEDALYAVPGDLVAHLAALDEDGCQRLTERWVQLMRDDIATIEHASTREHMLNACTVEAWHPVVLDLARLASKADEDGMGVFVCMTP